MFTKKDLDNDLPIATLHDSYKSYTGINDKFISDDAEFDWSGLGDKVPLTEIRKNGNKIEFIHSLMINEETFDRKSSIFSFNCDINGIEFIFSETTIDVKKPYSVNDFHPVIKQILAERK